MALFRPVLAAAIALALPLAAGARVSSDTTPGVNFAQYRTFIDGAKIDKHVADVMARLPARPAV